MEKKYFENFDGLRAISCILIILLHVEANTDYYFFTGMVKRVFSSFPYLTVLFMMISSFCLCAGYLEKFNNNLISIENFYRKRYSKILPFVIVLTILGLVYKPSLQHFYDAIVEVTFTHGFLPGDNIVNLNGVMWFLGVIFVFYLIFPAFTILVKNKKRAWFAFIISLLISFICENYYFTDLYLLQPVEPRHFFIYDLSFFILGGLFFLYSDDLKNILKNKLFLRILVIIFSIVSMVLYFIIPNKIKGVSIISYKIAIPFSFFFLYAIGFKSRLLNNRILKYISSISLELYLSHMFIFRCCQLIHLPDWFGNNVFSYCFTTLCVILFSILFIICINWLLKQIKNLLKTKKKEENK